jgi:hypothetical protein
MPFKQRFQQELSSSVQLGRLAVNSGGAAQVALRTQEYALEPRLIDQILALPTGSVRVADIGAAFYGEMPPYQTLLDIA